ncbi:MAG: hypothetical protein VX278_12595 [Myxococcota bacterium]|nr:hypothetical protein [Myxococcota bacterium]
MIICILSLVWADENWSDASLRDQNQYARSVSLDLRGRVPTKEEMLEIEASGGLSDQMLDVWLESEDFEEQVVSYHRSLFWNKLSTQVVTRRRLGRSNNIYYMPANRNRYRGNTITCGDFEAEFDEEGLLVPQVQEDGTLQEGWVYVNPYWDPENPIKMCAFGAQDTEYSASGVACNTLDGHAELDCGCGPGLQWCYSNPLRADFTDSVVQELDHRVRKMLREDLPYDEFLVQPFAQVNGPMVHYFKYIYPFDTSISPYNAVDELPDLDYTEKDTWVTISLDESAQGVFTSAAWLLRHQTNRGRANRFYGGFLCKEFIPVGGEIEGLSGTELPSPDLSRRQGCVDCHARLEPMAAYWARWGEASQQYIDPELFPSYVEDCATCMTLGTCSSYCRNNYVVEATHPDENPYLGWLKSYAFLRDVERSNADIGPSLWVHDAAEDGDLASCAAHNASEWLLGWSEQGDVRDSYANAFIETGLSFRELVRAIVRSDAYGRNQ